MRSGQEVEVLVVGGGPVGLGMAIGLRSLGVGCMVVERHPSTLDFPRGRGITVRTMEIFRRWGLEHDIVTAGLPRGESLYVFSGDTLLSKDFTRVGLPAVVSESPLSPTERLLCDQESMEVVLRNRAFELGADSRGRRSSQRGSRGSWHRAVWARHRSCCRQHPHRSRTRGQGG